MLGAMNEHAPALHAIPGLAEVEVVYSDFDGTLLGPQGSLLRGPDGDPSLRAAAALVAAATAGLEVVPVSGRGRLQLETDARLLGLRSCIAEAGGVIVRDGATWFEWGQAPRDLAGTPHDALEVGGALSLLLERFAGDLRPYEPWCRGREGGHLLHGRIDVAAANALLDGAGLGWAYVIDNGAAGGWEGRQVRAYHLVPRGVGKSQAVADDLASRGMSAAQALAVGDSMADMEMARVVGTYIQVANGHGPLGGNRHGATQAMGHGFAEAIDAVLRAKGQGV